MFCVGILHTPQMAGTRQHEDSATLHVQPCRTEAVGYIMYVRVECPRYAAASCFCRSPYRLLPTIPRLSAVLPLRGCALVHWSRNVGRKYRDLWNSNLNTNQSLHISPRRQCFYVHQFLRRFLAHVINNKTSNRMRGARSLWTVDHQRVCSVGGEIRPPESV